MPITHHMSTRSPCRPKQRLTAALIAALLLLICAPAAHANLGLIPTSAATDQALATAGPSSVSCSTNVRVPHYKLIYAVPTGVTSRASSIVPLMRTELYKASAFMNQQAGLERAGATRKIRVICDSSGVPVVDVVQLTINATQAQDFGQLTTNLLSLGYNQPADETIQPRIERYLIYVEANNPTLIGRADSPNDSTASPWTMNNNGRTFAVHFNKYEPLWDVLLHEMLHTMGAVQADAPQWISGGHCSKNWDLMCDTSLGVNPPQCTYLTLDCGHNTYFSVNTVAGSYLATHWNAGSPMNRFVDPGSEFVDYTKPSSPAYASVSSVGANGGTFTWGGSYDDVGVIYELHWSGAALNTIEKTTATSRAVTLTPGAQQSLTVYALDAAGNRAPYNKSALMTARADTTPPGVVSNIHAGTTTDSSIELLWDSATDDVSVTGYEIGARIAGTSDPFSSGTTGTPTTRQTIYRLLPGTTYDVRVRARDGAGNTGTWTQAQVTTAPDATIPKMGFAYADVGNDPGSVQVYWPAGTDNVGIDHYEIEQLVDGAWIPAASTTSTIHVFTGLTTGVTYTYRIAAVDARGNRSAWTDTVSSEPAAPNNQSPPPSPTDNTPPPAQQPPAPAPRPVAPIVPVSLAPVAPTLPVAPVVPTAPARDTIAPTVPTQLALRASARGRLAALTWRASRDAVGVTRYRVLVQVKPRVWKLRALVRAAARPRYALLRPANGRVLRLCVVAIDAAGNASPRSHFILVRG